MPKELLRVRRIVEFYASDAETLQQQIDNSLRDGYRAIWDTPEKHLGIRVETVGSVEQVTVDDRGTIVDASAGPEGPLLIHAAPDPHPVRPPGAGYGNYNQEGLPPEAPR